MADRMTPERLAEIKAKHPAHPLDSVYIYSAEHGAYWRVNAKGYTACKDDAWVLSRDRAIAHSKGCGPEKQIELIPYEPQPSDTQALLAEVERLQGELAELRKDSMRLDWLEQSQAEAYRVNQIVNAFRWKGKYHGAIRPTIDAAMLDAGCDGEGR